MRILIASAHRNLVGGVEKYLQAVIPGFEERGHEVAFLYEYPADPKREHIDSASGFLDSWCLQEADPQAVLASVGAWKPDVVYSHGFDGTDSVAIKNSLLDAYPVALYLHNYDHTCATGTKCHSFPQIQNCTRRLGPACLLLHYPRRCGGLHPGTMWRQYQRHVELNARLSDHQAILVASRHMYLEMERHGVSAEKLHLAPLPTTDVIPDGVPPAPKRLTGKIIFVGRLTDLKGAKYLIEAIPKAALRLNRPLSLTIAGDGPERGMLQETAQRLGVAVEFAGWVHTQRKLDLMREADLLAVPSLWPEPFGLVGIEAGCLGVPAVGYAVGGIPDWLIAGESGELAPGDPPTVDGLAEAMVRALASPEHYARLCQGAWKLAQRFTLESHLDQLEPILLEPGLLEPNVSEPKPGVGTSLSRSSPVGLHHD
jgi:glycosyltransferase involved in cell wall biosynthesis